MGMLDFLKRGEKKSVKPTTEYDIGQIKFVLPESEPKEYATSVHFRAAQI